MDSLTNKVLDYIPTDICTALQKYNAYLAGGSIVSLFIGIPVNDLDIFVDMKDGFELYDFLKSRNYKTIMTKYFETESEYSLFNGTFGRILMVKGDYRVDLVICKDKVKKCISSFDLTCCEIWFDGIKIDGTHLDDFFAKRTFRKLPKDAAYYHMAYWDNRAQKYEERGFEIKKTIRVDGRKFIPLTDSQSDYALIYKHLIPKLAGLFDI